MTEPTALVRDAVRQRFPHLADAVAGLPVLPGEDPWTLDELEEIAAGLLADQQRLADKLSVADRELATLIRESGEGAGDDQADYGSSAVEREQELSVVNNLRDLLEQTEHALDRIASGSYGTCEDSGQPIGKARLQAFPRATLSVEAKQRAERR